MDNELLNKLLSDYGTENDIDKNSTIHEEKLESVQNSNSNEDDKLESELESEPINETQTKKIEEVCSYNSIGCFLKGEQPTQVNKSLDDALLDKMNKISKKLNDNKRDSKIINKDLTVLKSKLLHLEKNSNRKKNCVTVNDVKINNDMLIPFDAIHEANETTLISGKIKGFYISATAGFLKVHGLKIKKYNVTGTIQIYDFNHRLMYDGILKDIVDRHDYYSKRKKKLGYFMSKRPKMPVLSMFDALIILKIFYY